MKRHSSEEARRFILEHTTEGRAPIVPELSLRLATESTALWRATEAWLEEMGLAPPYWAFSWVGGQALARFVLDHPEYVTGRVVIDFGSGGGIVAMAAKRAGAVRVVAIDRDPVALVACAINAEANHLEVELCESETLDVPAASDADIVLAGDVFYERKDAAAITASLVAEAARGRTVLAGCPGRAYTPTAGVTVVAELDVMGALELEGRERRSTKVLRF